LEEKKKEQEGSKRFTWHCRGRKLPRAYRTQTETLRAEAISSERTKPTLPQAAVARSRRLGGPQPVAPNVSTFSLRSPEFRNVRDAPRIRRKQYGPENRDFYLLVNNDLQKHTTILKIVLEPDSTACMFRVPSIHNPPETATSDTKEQTFFGPYSKK
jgi:hypothetical protein